MRQSKLLENEFRIYPLDRNLTKKWFIQGFFRKNVKNRRAKFTIPNFAKAEERESFAAALIQKLKNDGYEARPKTVKEIEPANFVIEQLEAHLVARKPYLKDKSYTSYRTHIRNLNTFCFKNKVGNITPEVAQKFGDWLKSRERSNTTINSHRITFRTFFKELVKAKKLRSNPFSDTKKLKECREGAHYFKLTEIARYKRYVLEHKPFLWLPSILQFYCFLRPGAELRHVTVGDVDLDRKLIRVSAETAKNGRFEYVKIPRPLQEYLLGMNLEDYPSTFFLIGTDGRPSEQIIYENYLGEHFRQVRAALKFPDKYKFYSFKHSGAINFMMNGGNVLSLMRQLRHKSLNTTEVYLRSIGVEEVVGLETMFSAI